MRVVRFLRKTFWSIVSLALCRELHECTLTTCTRFTVFPNRKNPRKRWITNYTWTDDTGSEILVTFCPDHIQEHWKLEQKDYDGLAQSEEIVKSARGK
jgi:hypothetical protein